MVLNPEDKSVSADIIAEALRAQGLSEEQIAATTGTYANAKYSPPKRKISRTFTVLSEREVKIGNDMHTLRLLGGGDIGRATAVLANSILELWNLQALPNGLPDEIEDILEQTSPMGWVDFFVDYILANLPQNDEYPEWMAAILDELAKLATTEERTITAGDIVSMPGGQLKEFVRVMVEVNKDDFLAIIRGVWLTLPESIRSFIHQKIFTPTLNIMQIVSASAFQSPEDQDSDGTPPSGGQDSSTTSEKTEALPKAS